MPRVWNTTSCENSKQKTRPRKFPSFIQVANLTIVNYKAGIILTESCPYYNCRVTNYNWRTFYKIATDQNSSKGTNPGLHFSLAIYKLKSTYNASAVIFKCRVLTRSATARFTHTDWLRFQVRRTIQICVIVYVGVFALWLKKGYQEFSEVESSVTTKVKGVTMSYLDSNSTERKGKEVALKIG